MTLNYTELMRLVRVRKEQIQDVALEQDIYNIEYGSLTKIELELATLIINERGK